jgi:uncharacterized membrane protein YdjX (TVP38/TMEM64 family)
MQSITPGKLLVGLSILMALVVSYWLLRESGALSIILDGAALRDWISQLGLLGPVAIVGLMAFAILVSPIPSAPIAIAAGAAYGHTWGTLYVLLGAEAGALAAFATGRLLGYEALHRWFGERLSVGLLGSQNMLMGVVFVSRLLPFVSFDLVSYAAGLTVLSFWRFAVATLAGIVPASFLLAHFGTEMASGETTQIMTAALVLGAVTLIPVAIAVLRRHLGRRRKGPS